MARVPGAGASGGGGDVTWDWLPGRMTLDEALRNLAARQHSLVSRRQARELGASTAALRHRLAGPDWEPASARVMRLVGSAHSVRQQLLVGVLDTAPDAVASHGSAALLWRLPGFGSAVVEVSRERGRSGKGTSAAVLHQPRFLPPSHVTECHGVPVTSVARTLFDLAGCVHPARVERLVDTVVARSPSVLAALHRVLDELGRPGRTGGAVVRALLAARADGYVPPASGLEARLARILDEAGEEPLDRQVDVGGHEWLGRVDFLDRRLRIVVEVDSDVHHTSLLDRKHDRRRDESLTAAGWRVVRVPEGQVWRRPHEAVATIRAARTEARRALAPGIDTMVSISGASRLLGAM
jgi:very-short-patch-repair endonuclease